MMTAIKFHQQLSNKIFGILLVFFLVALIAISMTLLISWQLEGGAAAINDAGSERMRSYRIASLLLLRIDPDTRHLAPVVMVREEMRRFEQTLRELERGDPTRPLALPKDNPQIQRQMRRLRLMWRNEMKPLIRQILAQTGKPAETRCLRDYWPKMQHYVGMINQLVLMIEHSNSHATALLRSFQWGLVILALVGTAVLIYLFSLLVIRPVSRMQEGLKRMAAEDFGVRLLVESRDEFGELATGFNQMADHLENLYATLEQRVKEKTCSLEKKNQDLQMLYEVAAFLNEPAVLEELCHAILKKMSQLLKAQGGVVRLVNPDSRQLPIVIHEGLSDRFLREEQCLVVGACLCGRAARDGDAVSWNLDQAPRPPLCQCCEEGFQAVAVVPIRSKKRVLGVFTLFFDHPRELANTENRLLETVVRHLGVAVENLRLISREREMAVSEERNLLAQELHDSIAQSLAFLNIQVQLLQDSLDHGATEEALDTVGQIREGVQESYDDVRELLVHFRTQVTHADMESATRSALEKFEGQTGIKTSLSISGVASVAPEYVIQVLHIIQEALSNIRKHAAATQVDVVMRCNPRCFIDVRDNGRGFDPFRYSTEGDSHVGIPIMKERAHRIGAELRIDSTPGAGTCVTLVLPGDAS